MYKSVCAKLMFFITMTPQCGYICNIFTGMQDDSNLRQSTKKKSTSAKGKCIYQNLRQPPKNQMSAKIFYY